jgi:predicted nuclease of restriction endonuclease-like (RecB) superfamily
MPSHEFETSALTLVSSLSFSHIRELLTVESLLARYFYETECIRCCWSVEELRRQISSNLFARCGISKNPEELIATLQNKDYHIKNDVKQPFTFEFLGLSAKDIITEKDLEQSLIDHLQDFLLELGNNRVTYMEKGGNQ